VLSLDAVVARLAQLLPPTFEGLQRDFAVGVVTAEGEHLLIDSGPLPEAVAASAAIPFVFSAVDVPG
jgi:predicted acylesterase/phospholipase RssA